MSHDQLEQPFRRQPNSYSRAPMESIRRESSHWPGAKAWPDEDSTGDPLYCNSYCRNRETTTSQALFCREQRTDLFQNVQNGQLRKLHLAKSGFGAGRAEHIKKKALMLKVRCHGLQSQSNAKSIHLRT